MDPSKIAAARQAGYSDTEIADFIAGSNPKIQAAREAGYKDSEILGHFMGPPPSLGKRIVDGAADVGEAAWKGLNTGVNYAGTQAVKAGAGILGLPRAGAEAIDWASRKTGLPPMAFGPVGALALTGKSLPTGEEIAQSFFDTTGAPEAKLEGVVPGGKVIDTAVQGALSVPLTGGATLPALMAGAFGGAGSEMAGQWAEGTPYEVPARLMGGLFGGVSGVGVTSAGKKAVKTTSAVVKPFSAKGRDELVGKALVDIADDPARSIANMETYQSPVPGFRVTAAKAAKDDSLLATENAMNTPGSGFGARANANNAVLTQALDQLDAGMDPKLFVAELAKQDAGAAMRAQAALDALPRGVDAQTAGIAVRDALRGRHDALTTARSQAVDPLYEAARNSPERVKPFPLMMSTADAIAANKGELKSTAESVRKLLFDANGKPDRSAAGMMATRDALTDMIGSAQPGSKQQRMLMGFKDEVDAALAVVPPEREARQTFAEMSRPLDPFQAEKGAPFVANVIEKDRYGSNFMLPAERVPTQFFRAGDAGAATMKEFLAANNGNAGAIDAMRSFISEKARSAKDVQAFLQQNRPAIEALDPALARQLEDAATTRGLAQGFKASPAGKFIDGDLDAAVKSTLGAPDSAKRMQSLRMSVGGSPEAVQGLQKAIIDDFRGKALATVAEDTTGNARLSANGAESWLNTNRGAAANVLSPAQIAGLEAISRSLKDQAQSAVKVAGSDTSRNLATRSILEAALWKGAGETAWLEPVRKTLGLAYGGANTQAMERMAEVLLDPKVAAALMKKATPGNVKMAEPLLATIGRGAVLPAGKDSQ